MAGSPNMFALLFLVSSLFLLRSVEASSVTSSKICYTSGQAFTISFVDSNPLTNDLIAITRVGSTAVLLSGSVCGSSGCSAPLSSGTVTMSQKLAVGVQYRAVLIRRSGTILATSTEFSVLTSCTTTAPTKRPTPSPTKRPTKAPTRRPTPTPTKRPVAAVPTKRPTQKPAALPTSARPTASPVTGAPTKFSVVQQTYVQAKAAITTLIQNDARLIPEFLRMGFHDCVGGCDGCIDLNNPDNNGLLHPILALAPVVTQFENKAIGVSRADLWSLASMTAADVAPHGSLTQPVPFNQKWFGRVNCEDANTVCRNNAGQVVTCTSTTGPGRVMASPNFDSAGVFNYFATNFGFDQRQTVAIMGAHSVGHTVQTESGINGPNGWTFDHTTLQNEYYNALMGAATASTPSSQVASLSPGWTRTFTNNTNVAGMPNRNTWALTVQGVPLVMLNSDIGLVRTLDSTNCNTATGAISCAYTPGTAGSSSLCPIASTFNFAAEFSDSNDVWMNEFALVMDLMLTAGYSRNACSDGVCPLTLNVVPTPPPSQAPIAPSSAPTSVPTSIPTSIPTSGPTAVPTSGPTAVPTSGPTAVPTSGPTAVPTSGPTAVPTGNPTLAPVAATAPPVAPTGTPTQSPTPIPTLPPVKPSAAPTDAPVAQPTASPTGAPTAAPTAAPVPALTPPPTAAPTAAPVPAATPPPTAAPTAAPVAAPTLAPATPTAAPVTIPAIPAPSTTNPSSAPTALPVGGRTRI